MIAILSELKIIEAIADRKSLEIFCSIARGVFEGEKLKQTLGLSNKQYYSRTEKEGSFLTNRFGHCSISRPTSI